MSIEEPAYLWLASGGLSNLTAKRMINSKCRKIVFYPDLGAFEKWKLKADELNCSGFDIKVSSILEEKATYEDKNEGFDIADYFIKNRLWVNRQYEDLSNLKSLNPALQILIDTFQLDPIN